MDKETRNKLRNVVTQCRKLLEDAVAQVLQGQFGLYASGKRDEVYVEDDARMAHLNDEDRASLFGERFLTDRAAELERQCLGEYLERRLESEDPRLRAVRGQHLL